LGERGINLIHKIVLEMGSIWTPSGSTEFGIDGYIEFCDPGSGLSTGVNVGVQSKAVTNFDNENISTFDFWCRRRDIEYWKQQQIPIILVMSKPDTGEAYWVDIKAYFASFGELSSPKIQIDKRAQRFQASSINDLVKLGKPVPVGVYFQPLSRAEDLYVNLLPLKSLPTTTYLAPTACRFGRDVWAKLSGKELASPGAWILTDKNIISFHNLGDDLWKEVCDQGGVEHFETSEWSFTDDSDRGRQFVQLLNRTLRSQLGTDIRYWPNEECFAFVGNIEQGTVRVPYHSVKRMSKIAAVTKLHGRSKDREYEWLRHMAFKGQFRRFDNWYFEITPTYRFTWDGYSLHSFHEDQLKRIKQIEGNRAVLSALMFWADRLQSAGDLFASVNPFLEFGELLRFRSSVGLNDKDWLQRQPQAGTLAAGWEESLFAIREARH
jgi:hypothetical protein